jgi:hypothetical protein
MNKNVDNLSFGIVDKKKSPSEEGNRRTSPPPLEAKVHSKYVKEHHA